jgi:UDP-3-O-[3-hydroxymyristoyl] glucosamine N-acyltransferase
MVVKLSELAALVGGDLQGNGDLEIVGAAPLHNATPTDITFLDKMERIGLLKESNPGAVVIPKNLPLEGYSAIRVDQVLEAFETIVKHFCPPRQTTRTGISEAAIVSESANIAEGVDIGPCAVIGDDVHIGPGCRIHGGVHIMAGSRLEESVVIFPNAVLYENTLVGPRCIIHAGALIGAYGFGYDSDSGVHILASQLGNVVLGADVEVGSGSTIDRGAYGPTIIGEGTKIDNLVMIAHNCRIGKHNLICAQVGIAGSTTTGDYVVLAGQVGVRDHVHIGSRAVLGAMSGVMSNVPEDARMVGIPATPEKEQMRKQAALSRLPEMRRQLRLIQVAVDRFLQNEQGDKKSQ